MNECSVCGPGLCVCSLPPLARRGLQAWVSGQGAWPHMPPLPIEAPEPPDLSGLLEDLRQRQQPIYAVHEPLTIIPRRPSLATYKAAVRRKHEQLQAAKARIAELERRIETRGGDWRRRD